MSIDHKDKNKDAGKEGYLVGYGRPPSHTRFKKGRSGNPSGRPKQQMKGLSKRLEEAMAREIEVNLNGETQTMPMEEVIANSLVNKAAKGDLKSVELIHKLSPKNTSDMISEVRVSWNRNHDKEE